MTSFDLGLTTVRSAMRGLGATGSDDGDDLVARFALAVWSSLAEPGDSVAWKLVAAIGPDAALRFVERGSVSLVDGAVAAEVELDDLAQAVTRWQLRLEPRTFAAALDSARRTGTRLLIPGDDEWPRQLSDLGPHAPLCLWVRGVPGALGELEPSIAFVGARAATGYGEHVAADLAAELSGSGIPVVSGAAYGIDGAAHRAALTVGGSTVAMLAGGVDRPYPAGHAQLISEVAQAGAIVSEVPCGSTPTKWRFLQRNRLIAALSTATVVVEAGWRSGALNTASHASTLGRPLGAVPGPITSAASAGCHRLLRDFDVRCITSAADVRELMGLDGDAPSSVPPEELSAATRPRTDDRTRVLDALSNRVWRQVGDLGRRAGMGERDVESQLGLLLLHGEAERGAQGWRLLTSATRRG